MDAPPISTAPEALRSSVSVSGVRFDDQGLFFTLLLTLVLLGGVFGPLTYYLFFPHAHPALRVPLWVFRLYRPNHTVAPAPAATQLVSAAAAACPSRKTAVAAAAAVSSSSSPSAYPLTTESNPSAHAANDNDKDETSGRPKGPARKSGRKQGKKNKENKENEANHSGDSDRESDTAGDGGGSSGGSSNGGGNSEKGGSAEEPAPAIPPPPQATAATAAAAASASPVRASVVALRSPCGQRRATVVRRKRVGVRLPYRASLRRWPASWREWLSIEESGDACEVVDSDEEESERRFWARANGAHHNNNNNISGGGKDGDRLDYDDDGRGRVTEESMAEGQQTAQQDYHPHTQQQQWRRRRRGPRLCRRAVPLDPQMRLYLAFLKYAAAALLLGSLFSVWISAVTLSDSGVADYITRRDVHKCRRDGRNDATLCGALAPYCVYEPETSFCQPVGLRGMYDLTIMNLSPGNDNKKSGGGGGSTSYNNGRWMAVALLNAAFVAVFLAVTEHFTRQVTPYAARVTETQLRKSLGYRVACVRGLPASALRAATHESFCRAYVDVDSYFPPPRRPPTGVSAAAATAEEGREGGGGGANELSASSSALATTQAAATTSAEGRLSLRATRFDGETDGSSGSNGGGSESLCECVCLDLDFWFDHGHYYHEQRQRRADSRRPTRRADVAETLRSDVVVEKIVVTRSAPRGMYACIARAESCVTALQEAVAGERALRRRQRSLRALHLLADDISRSHYTGQVRGDGSMEKGSTEHDEQDELLLAVMRSDSRRRRHRRADSDDARAGDYSSGGGDEGGARAEEEDGFFLLTRGAYCCGAGGPREAVLPAAVRHFRDAATELNAHIRQVPRQREAGGVFILFTSAVSAFEFVHLFNARRAGAVGAFSNSYAEIAGPPSQIIENNINLSKWQRRLRYALVFVLYVFMVLAVSVPTALLGSLGDLAERVVVANSNLNHLLLSDPSNPFSNNSSNNHNATAAAAAGGEGGSSGWGGKSGGAELWWGWERYARVSPGVQRVLAAYLPVLALALFYTLLPYVARVMAVGMGATTQAQRDRQHLALQSTCMVLTAVIFQAALQGGFSRLSGVLNPFSLLSALFPSLLGGASGDGGGGSASSPSSDALGADAIVSLFVACVTPQGGYWYARVLMPLAVSAWVELLDPWELAVAAVSRARARIQRRYDALFSPRPFEFPRLYSYDLTILSIGVLFHMTSPLLTAVVGLYFVLRSQLQRGKLRDRYRPPLPPEHDCTDFGVLALALRMVAGLLAAAEVGNALLCGLRGTPGSAVVSAAACAAAIALFARVWAVSRRWGPTIASVRRSAGTLLTDGSPQQTGSTSATEAAPLLAAGGPIKSGYGATEAARQHSDGGRGGREPQQKEEEEEEEEKASAPGCGARMDGDGRSDAGAAADAAHPQSPPPAVALARGGYREGSYASLSASIMSAERDVSASPTDSHISPLRSPTADGGSNSNSSKDSSEMQEGGTAVAAAAGQAEDGFEGGSDSREGNAKMEEEKKEKGDGRRKAKKEEEKEGTRGTSDGNTTSFRNDDSFIADGVMRHEHRSSDRNTKPPAASAAAAATTTTTITTTTTTSSSSSRTALRAPTGEDGADHDNGADGTLTSRTHYSSNHSNNYYYYDGVYSNNNNNNNDTSGGGSPFTGHLLPRVRGAGSRYQPKHQRLALVDADAAVAAIVAADFTVERYWDEEVTWYEADLSDV